jgi:hypothetical protein
VGLALGALRRTLVGVVVELLRSAPAQTHPCDRVAALALMERDEHVGHQLPEQLPATVFRRTLERDHVGSAQCKPDGVHREPREELVGEIALGVGDVSDELERPGAIGQPDRLLDLHEADCQIRQTGGAALGDGAHVLSLLLWALCPIVVPLLMAPLYNCFVGLAAL